MKKKKEPRWLQEQEKRRKFKTHKAITNLLLLIFLLLFLGISWRFYGFFKNSTWDGKNRLTLVLKIDPVSLVSFDPESEEISFLIIPDGSYIEAVNNYGFYRIEKIYPLGELEGRGVEFLSASLEAYLGLPIDGWVIADRKWTNETKSLLSSLIASAIKDKSTSSLSRWDLIRLWLAINQTRAHKIEVIDLGETTATEEFVLPDGNLAKKVDNQRLSRIISNLFTDYRIRREDLAIAVMNAGTETGLAAKAAKLISNIGGRLVEIGDWSGELDQCQLRTSVEARKSYTTQKLLDIFDCQMGNDSEGGRWELLLILTEEN